MTGRCICVSLKPGSEPRIGIAPLLPPEYLNVARSFWRRLVVEAHAGCQLSSGLLRPGDLVVVGRCPAPPTFGSGYMLQDVQPGLIEPVCRNLAEHAAVGKAAAGVGRGARARRSRILDEVVERAVLIERLREIAGPLGARSGRGSAARRCRRCAARIPGCRRRTACWCRQACRSGRRSNSPRSFSFRTVFGIAVQLVRPCCSSSSRSCAGRRRPSRGTGWCRSW